MFYRLDQEAWLDESWKLIHINQSRFYNFFQVGKFKKCLIYFVLSSRSRSMIGWIMKTDSHKPIKILQFLSSRKFQKCLIYFVLLSRSRNMIGWIMKSDSHKPTNILQFFSSGKIQKCLTQLWNVLAFSTISLLQAESCI